MAQTILRVDGEVAHPLNLTFDDLAAIPAAGQIADVSRFHPKRQGDGVALESLLSLAAPKLSATYLTLHATTDDFHASIPLAEVRGEGIVVYRLSEGPLPVVNGGPIRFLIRNPAACHTEELDDCANVKFVDRIELTAGKGHDNRPHDDVEHEKLHNP
ncbi:MAG TPA: molybdopterin-dependent oxidoreductase [Planctomycetaceae bacterium]|jgi:DMSO/TMAO reductase YedYZ molybdopterin-dependent catalytic subunit